MSAPVTANAWHRRAGPASSSRSRAGLDPPLPHELDALDRRGGAQEHRGGVAVLGGDDVGAPVHAVGEVHVQVAGRAEHRLGARASCRGRRGCPRRRTRGTPPPRRCAPRADARRRLVPHQQLVEQVGRELAGIARVERPRERAPAAHSGQLQPARLRRRAGRAPSTICSATDAGPAPPGVVRRRTAAPGSSSASASGPRSGSVSTSSSRATPRSAECAHQRADAGVRVAERHALLRPATRRGRPPPTCWPSAAACIRAVTSSAVASSPAIAPTARAGTGRARRTTAPCPPGGRGCTRAGGPSAWRGTR